MVKRIINGIVLVFFYFAILHSIVHADDRLALTECIDRALQNNFEVQIIRKSLSVAEGYLKSAKGFYDPQLGLHAAHYHSEEAQVTSIFGTKSKTTTVGLDVNQHVFTGGSITVSAEGEKYDSNSIFATLNPSYTSKLSLDVSQPLFKNFWGRQDKEAVFLSRNGVAIADLAVYEQIARFVVTVNQLYWNLVLSHKRLGIMEASLNRAERLLAHNKKRFSMGLVEETDVVQLEAVVALREVSVLEAHDAVMDAEDALRNAVYKEGVAHAGSIIPAESLDISEAEPSTALLANVQNTALQKRWDINQARLAVENKKFSCKARKNELLPLLDIGGGISYTGLGDDRGGSYDSAKSGDHPIWHTGLALQTPLGSRGVRGAYRAAMQEYEIAELQVKKLEKNILVETSMNVRRVHTSFKTIGATQKAEKLQERKLKLEEEKFKQGRSNVKTVIDFQDDLQAAQLETLKSTINYKLALVRLAFTQGTLFETFGIMQ